MATTKTNLNLRKGVGVSSPVLVTVPADSAVTVTGDPETWYPVEYAGTAGWMSGKYLDLNATPAPVDPYISKALALTEKMLGLWYRYGGNFTQTVFKDKRGDCSGFVGFVAEECGYRPGDMPLYDYAANQMLRNFRMGWWPSEKIKEGEEQPMDIVFYGYQKNGEPYAGHVVYALGNGKVRGASGGYQNTLTDADAKRVGACVRDDDIHFHKHGIVGIYRPKY